MATTVSYGVLLRHSAKDKAEVRPLAEWLLKDGLKVWFDERVLDPGDSIPAEIEERLEHFQSALQPLLCAPLKGSLAKCLYANWRPADREREYAQLLETRQDKGGKAQVEQTALLIDPRKHLSATHSITTESPISDS